jgi:hypothetical protein
MLLSLLMLRDFLTANITTNFILYSGRERGTRGQRVQAGRERDERVQAGRERMKAGRVPGGRGCRQGGCRQREGGRGCREGEGAGRVRV